MLRNLLLATAGLILTAAGTRAEDPKARVNLEELKYAVTMAEKRGENVGAVAEALATFEKALAKNAAKLGEAPPELAALREAVEAAAKKGENVEVISKELGLIEKALTGREYERPKPPEPKLELVPPLRRGGPGRVVIGGGMNGRVVIGGGGDGINFNSITISNGNFTIKARVNDVIYTLTGSIEGTEAPKIIIQAGEKKIEADDPKKVPEEYRATVEKLLGSISR